MVMFLGPVVVGEQIYLHQTAQFYCPPKTASNGITVDAATINIDARQIKIGFRLIFQIEQATGHEIKLSGNTYNASFFNVQLYVVDSIIPKHIYAIDNSKKSVLCSLIYRKNSSLFTNSIRNCSTYVIDIYLLL